MVDFSKPHKQSFNIEQYGNIHPVQRKSANRAYKQKLAQGLQSICHLGKLLDILTDSVHAQTKERHDQDRLGRVLCELP